MSDEKEKKNLPWLFRGQPPAGESGAVEFDPADALYILRKNTRNPYLKRAIAPTAPKAESSPADRASLLKVLDIEGGYGVEPANSNRPYTQRTMKHPPPPPATEPRYQETGALAGDIQKLPWLINDFFKSILSRLGADPGCFDDVVNDLLHLFKENSVKVKLYEAYYNFEDWDDLMETLEEISHYPSPETFDLFCSALLTYYELVYPPGDS